MEVGEVIVTIYVRGKSTNTMAEQYLDVPSNGFAVTAGSAFSVGFDADEDPKASSSSKPSKSTTFAALFVLGGGASAFVRLADPADADGLEALPDARREPERWTPTSSSPAS